MSRSNVNFCSRATSDREDFDFEKTSSQAESKPLVVANNVDDVLMKSEKLTEEEENERAVDIDKAGGENFDSEEETGEDWKIRLRRIRLAGISLPLTAVYSNVM